MKLQQLTRRPPRIEMVPLIDAFFLILSFFISSVLTLEVVRGLPVELPSAAASSSVPKENRWVVTLGANGLLQLQGEPITLEALRQRLSSVSDPKSLQVGIRAEGKAVYERVVGVLGVVREAGVARVTLLTSPRPEEKRLAR